MRPVVQVPVDDVPAPVVPQHGWFCPPHGWQIDVDDCEGQVVLGAVHTYSPNVLV